MPENKSEVVQNQQQVVVRCPVCFRQVWNRMGIEDWNKDKAMWFFCFCGSIFHAESPIEKHLVWNLEYRRKYNDYKRIREREDYFVRVYSPLIEELTWGRRFLDVGYTEPHYLNLMRDRGWLAQGIDIIPSFGKELQGDYETYDFKGEKYDLITMKDVLQSFDNPVGAINKAYKMLNPGGILMVVTPDADLFNMIGRHNWGHWNRKEHRVYMSGNTFKKTAERIGFDIISFWRNNNNRFLATAQFHAICQKPFIRLDTEQMWNMEEQENGKADKLAGDK